MLSCYVMNRFCCLPLKSFDFCSGMELVISRMGIFLRLCWRVCRLALPYGMQSLLGSGTQMFNENSPLWLVRILHNGVKSGIFVQLTQLHDICSQVALQRLLLASTVWYSTQDLKEPLRWLLRWHLCHSPSFYELHLHILTTSAAPNSDLYFLHPVLSLFATHSFAMSFENCLQAEN